MADITTPHTAEHKDSGKETVCTEFTTMEPNPEVTDLTHNSVGAASSKTDFSDLASLEQKISFLLQKFSEEN